MKKLVFLILSVFTIVSIVNAQDTQDKISPVFEKANEWLQKNNLSITTSPEQAFINDYILVAAEGLPSPTAKTPAQRRLTAERAATTLAYRQLAEFLEGVAVVGDTLVRDAELQYDVVRTAVAGFVKGAQVVYKEWNPQEEVALVIVKIGMTGPKGFGSLMYEKILGDPKIKKEIVEPQPQYRTKPVKLEEIYDGLIVDATEVNFRPALINRIFNSKGEVLYDPSKISQKVLVEQGCGEYTNSIEKAKAALEKRGVKNPLIIKASGTVSPSDLQVSDEDAVKIYSANQKANFFASAKVAFVLK
uniref:LPP20 lipoprotein n=1 Tax=Thermodesulfovibrio aggregans TaxID=86166 RepID=A0A7C4AIH0_9BACT